MLDQKQFRSALGCFATGVTVVTTRDANGAPVGVTANSYNSVSLDPPMVLWSLARTSLSLDAFMQGAHFAVHVLGEDQRDTALRFATRGGEKFAGLDCAIGTGGVPLLEHCVARFECRTVHRYEGGDHIIFVGEVEAFSQFEKNPLLFHLGQFARVQHTSG